MGRFLGVSIPVAKVLRKAGIPLPKKSDGSSIAPVDIKSSSKQVAINVVEKLNLSGVDNNFIIAKLASDSNVSNLLTSNESKDKTFVGGLFTDLWGNVKDGLGIGVGNAGQTLMDKLTGKIIGSSGVKGSQDSISDYASGIMESSIAKYFKRNWFYILFPIIGILVFAKFLFNGKKSNRRKRKY